MAGNSQKCQNSQKSQKSFIFGFSVMPKFKTKAMPHTEQQRIRNLRIAIERVHVGKYFMSKSPSNFKTVHLTYS